MVDGVNGNNSQNNIKIKGTKTTIDINNLEGLQQTKKNKPIFDIVDGQNGGKKDGVLDEHEAEYLKVKLETAAGNDKISKREMKKGFRDKNTFDALKSLQQQQKARKDGTEYVEKDGDTTTIIFNSKNKDVQSYKKVITSDGKITMTLEDGTVSVTNPDGTEVITKPDGTQTFYDQKNNITKVVNPDKTSVEQKDNKTITRDKDGKITRIVEEKDGKEIRTDFEYADGKTIARTFDGTDEDAKLTSITVSEQKDGHKVDTKYLTEDDMKNNKPSEKVIDADNPALKKTMKYTYDANGNVKIETTDSSGKTTTSYTNSKGEEIKPEDFDETKPGDDNKVETTHTVVKGEGIGQIVTDALKAQGIENPTEEQLKAAKKAFLEANKDLVKTYHGVKKEWHGNKFFYPDDVVKIPDFKTLLDGAETKTTPTDKTGDSDKTKKVSAEQKAKIQETLGDDYIVEYAEDGSLVVKDKSGKILPEITKTANDTATDEDDIDKMLKADKNNNKELELDEYSEFINGMLRDSGITLSVSNQSKLQTLINESFNTLDTSKNARVDKEELTAKAKEVIQKLTDDIGKLE